VLDSAGWICKAYPGFVDWMLRLDEAAIRHLPQRAIGVTGSERQTMHSVNGLHGKSILRAIFPAPLDPV
jgi:hypothetical protein